MIAPGSSLKRARRAWGGTPPDWIVVLAEAADRLGQDRAGRLIGMSGSTVNQVLGRVYRGDLGRVERAVRGRFMAATVDCPVLGPIRADLCLRYQRQRFAATTPERVALSRTCPGCPHNRNRAEGLRALREAGDAER